MTTLVQRFPGTTLSRPRRPSTPRRRLAKQDLATGTLSRVEIALPPFTVSHENSTAGHERATAEVQPSSFY